MDNFPMIYLNSNDGNSILAFGQGEHFRLTEDQSVSDLQKFIDQNSGKYLFGYLSYDLKEKLHGLVSENIDNVQAPLAHLWVPRYVVKMNQENFKFVQGEKNVDSFEVVNMLLEEETDQNHHHYHSNFQPKISKEDYIKKVMSLKEHIQQGDIYEVNFCQEFFIENIEIPYTLDTYFNLNSITKAPFSAFMELDDIVAFCGSPERFLKKDGGHLISQPIKGTAARGKESKQDAKNIKALLSDPKERAENIMIVDLVRNDLSQIAVKNSVKVDNLCQIQTFETVHQMVSTVSCDVEESCSFTQILKATFPMGSMTGVPKKRAMELIDSHESFKRGIFSGSIGYIAPDGDFDFNVVIRTLIYNRKEKYLSCSVGGAITIHSDPEKEYKECMIKIEKILKSLTGGD